MTRIPKRQSLVSQTADILRQDLRDGRWPMQLPGEHHLSDLLKVSRSTLRAALAILRREGLLRVSQGRRRWLTPSSRRTAPPSSATVGVISSLPLQEFPGNRIFIMDELRRHLQQCGFTLEIHALPPSTQRTEVRQLKLLTDRTGAACWLLASCTKELQAWFARGPWPTLVLGSCHSGIDLPSFSLDYPAACRHAVGVLRRMGHSRVAMLSERTPFAGIHEIEDTFQKALGATGHPTVRHHDGSVGNIERLLAGLMREKLRPTAIVSIWAADALTTLCHLLRTGVQVPADVSLLSLFDDFLLNRVTPSMARYGYNQESYARRLSRVVIQMAMSRARPRSVRIVPEFIPGGSMGRAP